MNLQPREPVTGRTRLERAVQRALRAVAIDALVAGEGGRLPTIAHYQGTLGLGAGTVQEALSILDAAGALTTVARGHLGRSIQSFDIGGLWRLAGLGALRCVLPPPGSLEQRGLVEALVSELDRVGIQQSIVHRRGARLRIECVRTDGSDVATASRGSLARLVDPAASADLVTIGLGKDTYYAPDRMRVISRDNWDSSTVPEKTRVAIDRDSWDQVELTEAEFPPELGYQYVEWSFPRAPVAVARGIADVAVWHKMELLIPLELAGLTSRSLRRPEALAVRESLSEAILLMPSSRPELSALFGYLDTGAVRRRQGHLLALSPDDPELGDAPWAL